jgi:dephospho-CoA kinase
MKIIAFTGMPYSGKTEAVQIAKEKNIPVIRMGELVWEETQKQKLALTDQNVGTIANKMRKQHGMDIWAQKTLEKIKSIKQTEYLVIDGIRNREEVNLFRKELGPDFLLIGIEASKKVRQQRIHLRGRTDDVYTMREFQERDKRELSWGLAEVIASSDIIVSNEGSLETFREKINEVFDQL